MLEYEGHWVKVKVILLKLASWTVGHQIGQGHTKVTVILRTRSFKNQIIMCFDFHPKVGSWLLSECLSYLFTKLLFGQNSHTERETS